MNNNTLIYNFARTNYITINSMTWRDVRKKYMTPSSSDGTMGSSYKG